MLIVTLFYLGFFFLIFICLGVYSFMFPWINIFLTRGNPLKSWVACSFMSPRLNRFPARRVSVLTGDSSRASWCIPLYHFDWIYFHFKATTSRVALHIPLCCTESIDLPLRASPLSIRRHESLVHCFEWVYFTLARFFRCCSKHYLSNEAARIL